MNVLYIVVPLALVIVSGALTAFVWAAQSGQMDDLETPARRMLFDDDHVAPAGNRDNPPHSNSEPTKPTEASKNPSTIV